MSRILGFNGLAEDHWPRDLLPPSIEPYLPGRSTIPHTLEGIAERTVVEAYQQQKTDRARSLGIFDAHTHEQAHVSIAFHGFIKYVSLAGYGNWNGSRVAASRACLRLELDGRGCSDAFDPQLDLMKHLRMHVMEQLEAEDTGEVSNTLRFQHVLFRKVTNEEAIQPPQMSRREDPTGKLARIAREWRLNPRPTLCKRNESGKITSTTATSFAVNDFVLLTAHPELIYRDGRGKTSNKARIVLAVESVTRLYNHKQLKDMQVPVAMERRLVERMATEVEGETQEPEM